MKIVSSIVGVICLLGMLLGFIPFLGWLNWLVVPLAIIGLILRYVFNVGKSNKMFMVVIVVGTIRLILGGGLL